MDSLTEAEIEAGRLLFAGECQFIAASNSLSNLAPMERAEIAFAGRSNVGKSSLVNALTGRKHRCGRHKHQVVRGSLFSLIWQIVLILWICQLWLRLRAKDRY